MNQYKIIAENPESTVVTDFQPAHKARNNLSDGG